MAKSRPGIWQMSVKQRQTFLKNRGYNVNIDGKSGPQTFAAGWAYQHGLHPQAYNAHDAAWRLAIWQHSGPQPLHGGDIIQRPARTRPVVGHPRPDDRAGPRTVSAKLGSAAKALAKTRPSGRPRIPHPTQPDPPPDPPPNKSHGGNDNPPKNAGAGNQSFGPPVGDDALPPGMQLDNADIIAPKLGNIEKALDPNQYADTAAGQEFDAQIGDTKYEQAKLAAQAPANLAQLDAMWGGVSAAQSQGAAQDVAAGKSIAASQDALVQGLVSSLGGAANAGSAGVAQAGVDASGYMRALDKIQQSTDQEIGTSLKAEGVQQHTAQASMDNARAADLAHQLMSLQGQRGSAAAAARLDALKYNNDVANANFANVQHIREVNLDTQQQLFQNKIAAQNAIIAARAAGDQHLALQLQNAYAKQFPNQAFGKGAPTASQSSTAINRAVQQAQKFLTIKQPQTIRRADGSVVTNPHAGQIGLDPRYSGHVEALVKAVNSSFAGLHSTNKAALAARNRILRQYGVAPRPEWKF